MSWPRLLIALAACSLAACSNERTRSDGTPATGAVHPEGILDPASDDFHGRELARLDYRFATCAKCHGEDFSGGTANTSCLTCHAQGPTACVTCHGPGPTSAAHPVHLGAGKLACSECHTVPAAWDAPGHILVDGKADRAPAEVTFGARAGLTAAPADRAGPPSYAAGRCTNVYCHGDVLPAGGLATEPRWDAPATGACDGCHGAPPPGHVQGACTSCHPTDVHVDGVVQVGRDASCSGCHGDQASPAPPTDLSGNQANTALGVGAHRAHLDAPSGMRGPIPCGTCHQVPAQLGAPGHIDTSPPAEVNAELGWDRASATCTSAWCHGPARPVWTTTGYAGCGTCHGIPPATPSHDPDMTIPTCGTCHPQTIDATGIIILTPGPNRTSTHINGTVDVR